MLILYFCAYFFPLIFTVNGVVERDALCNCTNPVYIDQPTNIVQCYVKSKFYDQVNANYAIVNGFIDQQSAKHCNYTEYRSIINEMKKVTLQIVDAYFKKSNSNKTSDCITTIKTAFQKYVDVLLARFIKFLACSYTYFSPECAVNIKHAAYFSAENIMSTLTECCNLKASRPDCKLLLLEFTSEKTNDCNCVKIDERPIPVSEKQCYSPEYISILKKFIRTNFDRVEAVYHNASKANPQCNYSSFIERVKKLDRITSQMPNILQESRPTFKKLSALMSQVGDIASETNAATREYIIKMDKRCYFTPRKVRQSALTIANYVNQILTKCVLYKDRSNSIC